MLQPILGPSTHPRRTTWLPKRVILHKQTKTKTHGRTNTQTLTHTHTHANTLGFMAYLHESLEIWYFIIVMVLSRE